MGDRITFEERTAIAAYLSAGGKIVRCPDGAAVGASDCTVSTFGDWLAEHGLAVTAIPPDQKRKPNRLQEVIAGRGYSVDSYLDKAA